MANLMKESCCMWAEQVNPSADTQRLGDRDTVGQGIYSSMSGETSSWETGAWAGSWEPGPEAWYGSLEPGTGASWGKENRSRVESMEAG